MPPSKQLRGDFRGDIEFLLKKFKPERILNNILAVIALLLLFALTIYEVFHNQLAIAATMCGPTGLIAYTYSRFFKMWSDCTDIYKQYISGK
jgi:hypothetical protein